MPAAAVAPPRSRRLTLPPHVAFTATALTLSALYVAAGAPSPMLSLLEHRWGFAPWVLTVAFAVYALGLLAALLVTGSLSDYVGRRPVMLGALALELIAMVMFAMAPNIGWVIAARILQGVATGAATSAFTAAVLEQAPPQHQRIGIVVGAVAPAGGLGLGALMAGMAIQITSHANEIIFTALGVAMALGMVTIALSTETVSTRPGAVASLRPRVSVPVRAGREFAAAVPVLAAAWLLLGLFMGLVPSIVRGVFGIDSGLVGGATTFVEPAAAAIAGVWLGQLAPRRATILGAAAVAAGASLIVVAVLTANLPAMVIGGVIGGVGFGASFSGALRSVAPLAGPHQRAGLFAAVYLVGYLSFGVPVILAGLLITPLGLTTTVAGYGVAIVITSAAGLLVQSWGRLTVATETS